MKSTTAQTKEEESVNMLPKPPMAQNSVSKDNMENADLSRRLLERHPHVGRTEGVFGGKLIVGGIRIAVTDILAYLYNGESIECISENYGLTSEQIKCAIAFAQDFIEESDDRGAGVGLVSEREQYAKRGFDAVMAIEASEYTYSNLQKAAMVAAAIRSNPNTQEPQSSEASHNPVNGVERGLQHETESCPRCGGSQLPPGFHCSYCGNATAPSADVSALARECAGMIEAAEMMHVCNSDCSDETHLAMSAAIIAPYIAGQSVWDEAIAIAKQSCEATRFKTYDNTSAEKMLAALEAARDRSRPKSTDSASTPLESVIEDTMGGWKLSVYYESEDDADKALSLLRRASTSIDVSEVGAANAVVAKFIGEGQSVPPGVLPLVLRDAIASAIRKAKESAFEEAAKVAEEHLVLSSRDAQVAAKSIAAAIRARVAEQKSEGEA